MNSKTPKVLLEVCGRPMLAYVVDACRAAGVEKIYCVVGYAAEMVKEKFADATDIEWVLQSEQNGTGHAVLCCKDKLTDFDGLTFVLCGDGPLIRAKTLQTLLETNNSQTCATLATAMIDDPTGYGRIVRNGDGTLKAIVEHKDCTDEQLNIKEINPSYYLFDNKSLFEALDNIKNDNSQGEYYLTDVFEIMAKAGKKVGVVAAVDPQDSLSANTQEQVAMLNDIMQKRLQNNNLSEKGCKGNTDVSK